MRWLPWVSILVIACGGKIAPDGDAGDAQTLCKATLSTCSASSECCSGSCDPQTHACAMNIGCAPDLSTCMVDSDCCTGLCSTGDDLCGCVTTNETGCGVDSDCCSPSNVCLNGTCQ